VDVLVLASVCVVAALVWSSRQASTREVVTTESVQRAVARLYERASYYGALENSPEASRTLWPVAVLPEWFCDAPPINALLPGVAGIDGGRPWIDVAPPGDEGAHPPDPVAVRPEQAQFWYNPNVGVFRARVAATLGSAEALTLYNRLNGVELDALTRDGDPQRQTLAYTPGRAPAATLASAAAGEPGHAEPAPAAEVSIAPPPPASLFRGPREVAVAASPPKVEPVQDEPAKPRGRARRTAAAE
jgi:hypothetical protein